MATVKIERNGKHYDVFVMKTNGWYKYGVQLAKKNAMDLQENADSMSITQVGTFVKENRTVLKDRIDSERIKALLKGNLKLFYEFQLDKSYTGTVLAMHLGQSYSEGILKCGCTMITFRTPTTETLPKTGDLITITGRFRTYEYPDRVRAFLETKEIKY